MQPSHVRRILRQRASGSSLSSIAAGLGIDKTTVMRILDKAKDAGIDLEKADGMTDLAITETLYPPHRLQQGYHEPDWESVFLQHARKSQPVSLKLLWEEYFGSVPPGQKPLGYKAFCKLYKKMKETLPVPIRDLVLIHQWDPGEVAMIDYSGDGITVSPPEGKKSTAQIFVGVLGCSGYIFCCATPDQTKSSWLHAIKRMLTFFGGVPECILLDNSTSLVRRADNFHPLMNDDFQALCDFYQTSSHACRPAHPRDKGLVENAVGLVQRNILNPLQGQFFSSVEEVDKELAKGLERLNGRKMAEKLGTRKERFEQERPFLRPLPAAEYEPDAIVKTHKVQKSYCVRVGGRRYSVPHEYAGVTVKVVIYPVSNTLECYDLRTGRRIAQHAYDPMSPVDSICREHMPPQHLAVSRTVEELLAALGEPGTCARRLAERVVKDVNRLPASRMLSSLFAWRGRLGQTLFESCCREELKRPSPSYDGLISGINQKIGPSKTEDIDLGRGVKMAKPKVKKNIRGEEYYSRLANSKKAEGEK